MRETVKTIVEELKNRHETIAFMESCTGGKLANEITNISGSSEVLRVSLVTYSDEYKVKFGVSSEVIEGKGVYSNFVSQEMAEKVCKFCRADWTIGITGQLEGENSEVYYTIYNGNEEEFYDYVVLAKGATREEKKEYVAEKVFSDLLELF